MGEIIIIGYSGHAFVVIDTLQQNKHEVIGYLDQAEKSFNPFCLEYMGSEDDQGTIKRLKGHQFIVTIGNNRIRANVFGKMIGRGLIPINAIHPRANIGANLNIGTGNMIMAAAIINSFSKIGNAVIINSGAIIEHECMIEDYAHIAPGAVLAGNVKVGHHSFIGANAVIKEGVTIGNKVIIGAGSVVIRDLADGVKVAGNPAKNI